MFVEPACAQRRLSEFWASPQPGPIPGRGIQAHWQGRQGGLDSGSYNPCWTRNGKVYRVIKFATDITAEKLGSMERCRHDCGDRTGASGDRVQSGWHGRYGQRKFPENTRLFRLARSRASITACSSSRRCAIAPRTVNSGPVSTAANTRPRNTSASARRQGGLDPGEL